MAHHDQYDAGPENSRFPDQDASLGQYLVPLIRKWWIIVIVLGLTLLLAAAFSRWSDSAGIYEARTRLLIVVPISERIIGESGGGPDSVTRLSIDTLSALVAANDLLETIITKLGLHDSEGEPWDPTRLADMMESEIETADGGTNIPLLTTTVRGDDPELTAQIAQTWAEAFLQKNSELFASEAAGSYEFISGQYQSIQKESRETQSEWLAYQQAAQTERVAYELLRQGQRLTYQQTRQAERLPKQRARRDERVVLRKAPLERLEAELGVVTPTYAGFLALLPEKRSALVADQARLASIAESLAAEEPFIIYERRMPSDVIWSIVSADPPAIAGDGLADLIIEDQESNDLYLSLTGQKVSLRSDIASLMAEIQHLESKIDEAEEEMARLTGQISKIQADLLAFDQDTEYMLSRFDEETTAELSRFDQETTVELASLDGNANLVLSRLDREISSLTSNTDRLVQSLQEAEIAKAEQTGSIRIVESAVRPRAPIAAARGQFGIGIGPLAVVGLFLGVVAAAAVNYGQNLLRSVPGAGSAPKGEPEPQQ